MSTALRPVLSGARRPVRCASALVLLVAACGARPDDEEGTTAPGLPPLDFTEGESGTGGDGSGSGDGDRFDLGGPQDTAGPGPGEGSAEGCAKVDFLFVIDSSGSMQDEQQNLVGSFPGFIEAIRTTITAQDYQILVTDTDAAPNGQICQTICGTGVIPDCMGIPCNMVPPPGGTGPCDTTLGSGLITDQNGGACNIMGPQRYIIGNQPDLDTTFACLAEVGTLGDGNEQQAGAMIGAVSPALTGPGGCNEGFLRDDAILVVTLITDEEDGPDGADDDTNSAGNPTVWRQALVDAKNGNENAIVFLGLLGDSDVPGGVCTPLANNVGAEPAPQLRGLVETFGFGLWGSVCSANYAPFFSEAISVIDSACDDFVPPG